MYWVCGTPTATVEAVQLAPFWSVAVRPFPL